MSSHIPVSGQMDNGGATNNNNKKRKGRLLSNNGLFSGLAGNDKLTFFAFSLFIVAIFASGVFVGIALFHSSDRSLAFHHRTGLLSSSLSSGSLRTQTFKDPPVSSSSSIPIDDQEQGEQVQSGSTIVRQATLTDFQKLMQRSHQQGNNSTYYFCLKNTSNSLCSQLPSTVFDTRNYAMYRGMAMDGAAVTVSTWIWLDPNDTAPRMKTIIANRASGCDVNRNRYGYAFYINDWNTNNLQLILMWGTDLDGCEKIATVDHVLKYGSWYHVGFVLKNTRNSIHAAIYVDGKQVASTEDVGNKRNTLRASANRPIANSDAVGLFIGAHSSLDFPFGGRISDLTIYKEEVTSALLWDGPQDPPKRRAPAVEVMDSLFAYYPLNQNISFAEGAVIPDLSGYHRNAVMKMNNDRPEPSGVARAREIVQRPPPSSGNAPFSPGFGLLVDVDEDLLVQGTFPDVVDEEILKKSDMLGRERSKLVSGAMKFIWENYERYTFGSDELKPVSGKRNEPWGSVGMTLIDSMDTLWLMGLKDEFKRGVEWVRTNLDYNKVQKPMSVFETNIRELGGLLAAYEMSGDRILLQKAIELGDKLLPAFNTKTGIPHSTISFIDGRSENARWTGGASILSELGTMQLEFRSLSFHSGDPRYGEAAEKVYDVMRHAETIHGLAPIYVNPTTGTFTNKIITFGALGDSYYEYLLKVWIQGGRKEKLLRRLYDEAMDGMHELLVQRTKPSGFAYLGDYAAGSIKPKMDHLVCFVPGMLALGVYMYPEHPRAQKDLELAKALMYTCVQMYARSATGLSPEYMTFPDGEDMRIPPNAAFYILRPETSESLFILHHITGHPIYRDWGHAIMTAIEKYTRTTYGYGSHPDVRSTSRPVDDRMESFFMAETLKYLYLLQNPDHEIDLMKVVFNTEAHPLKQFPDDWRKTAKLDDKSKFLFDDSTKDVGEDIFGNTAQQ